MPCRRVVSAVVAGACTALSLAAGVAAAEPPDPMARGPFAPVTVDPVRAGTVALQEPAANGNPPAGASAAVTVALRGSLYYPAERVSGSPVIILVHGNHGSCNSRGTGAELPHLQPQRPRLRVPR